MTGADDEDPDGGEKPRRLFVSPPPDSAIQRAERGCANLQNNTVFVLDFPLDFVKQVFQEEYIYCLFASLYKGYICI